MYTVEEVIYYEIPGVHYRWISHRSTDYCPCSSRHLSLNLFESRKKFNEAGALYSKSVDLANEGKYEEALKAANDALALNVTSLEPLIQSNRAGILVMLGRNREAITAA